MTLARMRQALPAALVAHGCNTLCALATALPLADSVGAAPSALTTPKAAALSVAMRLLDQTSDHPFRYLGLPLAVTLLTAPFLLLLWLHASATRAALELHARAAARQYLRACGVRVGCAAYAALLLVAAAGLGYASYRLLAGTHDLRLQTYVGLLAAAPFMLALLHAASLHDAAHAALCQGAGSTRAALRSAFALTTAQLVLTRSVFALGGLFLTLAGSYLPRALFGLSTTGSLASLLAGQVFALLSTLLRGAWLALLTRRAQRAQVVT
jgi:hypothetical protein